MPTSVEETKGIILKRSLMQSVMVLIIANLMLQLICPIDGSLFESIASPSTRGCPESYKKFEIMSGYAFSSPADSFASIPGCLELTSCLSACRNNDSCMAINFETGLCVLLSSSANQKPGSLKESQFPVFTIYAQKVCISDYGKCSHSRKRRKETKGSEGMVSWVYERVPGHQLALVPDSSTGTSDPSSSSPAPSSLSSPFSSSPASATSFYPDPASSFSPPPPLNEFASTGSSWSPGLTSESHPSSSSSPASFDSSSDPTSITDYTTARNNFPKQQQHDQHQVVQQEQEPLKHHKKLNTSNNNKKKRTRLVSSPDQKVQEIRASSLLRCAEACLQESSFPCLSANFQKATKKCTLMSFDRHSLAIDSETLKLSPEEKQELKSTILTASPAHDYIEMNCRGRNDEIAKADPNQAQFLCDFKPLPGLVLKTVDAIYEGVDSLTECKKKCLEAPFQCYSFDLGEDSSGITSSSSPDGESDAEIFAQGDPFGFDEKKRKKIKKRMKNSKRTSPAPGASSGKTRSGKKSVCRISHLDRSALFHLQDPYSHLPGVTTYERNNCFNIQVHCGRDRMKALFSSTKSFTGKIYSARAPATCSQTLESKNSFSIDIPYFTSPTPTTGTTSGSSDVIPSLVNPFTRQQEGDGSQFTDCGVTASSVRGGRGEDGGHHPHDADHEDRHPIEKQLHKPDSGEEMSKDPVEVVSIVNGNGAAGAKRSRALHHPLHHHHASSSSPSDPLTPGSSSRPTFARFSVSLVLQRHALIVTSADFDITLNCDYNLSQQKIVSNSITLYSHSPNEPDWNGLEEVQAVPTGASNKHKPPANNRHPPVMPQPMPPIPPPVGGTGVGSVIPVPHVGAPMDPLTHEATFHSPVVRMSITDRSGGPVRSAEVGDPLSLRFEVQSDQGRESMYDVFVKNIVADDGVDTSELELIDNRGCPTDPSIMGPLRRVHVSSISRKVLEAPFEAFKFPTSAIVQFRALIVPCIAGDCQPVLCTISSSFLTSSNLAGHQTFSSGGGSKTSVHSYGKRSADMAAYARSLLHSNESAIVADLLVPKELEERVFIEVLDKKEEEKMGRQQQPEPERDAQGLERSLDEDNNNGSDDASDDNNNTSSNIGNKTSHGNKSETRGRKQKDSRQESDNLFCGLNIPTPWLICCLCLLCIQVVCLIRFYFSNRDAKLRIRHRGFRNPISDHVGY